MPFEVECFECRRVMTLRDEVAGRNFRCPGCSCILAAPTAEELGLPKSVPVSRGGSQSESKTREHSPKSRPPRPRSPVRKSVVHEPVVTDPLYSVRPEELVSRGQEVYVETMPEPMVAERERLASEEYDARMRTYNAAIFEAAIFQLGFAAITAAFAALLYYGDKAPSDPVRHETIFENALNVAMLLAAMGGVTLVGFRPFLYVVATILAVFTFITAAFLWITSNGSIGVMCMYGAVPLGFGACSNQLLKAAQRYPG